MQNKYVFASGDTHSIYLHGFIVGESLGSQIVHASVIYSEKDLSPKSVPFYFLFIYFCLSLNILSLAWYSGPVMAGFGRQKNSLSYFSRPCDMSLDLHGIFWIRYLHVKSPITTIFFKLKFAF